jgi:hypothetical protein
MNLSSSNINNNNNNNNNTERGDPSQIPKGEDVPASRFEVIGGK